MVELMSKVKWDFPHHRVFEKTKAFPHHVKMWKITKEKKIKILTLDNLITIVFARLEKAIKYPLKRLNGPNVEIFLFFPFSFRNEKIIYSKSEIESFPQSSMDQQSWHDGDLRLKNCSNERVSSFSFSLVTKS